jgi:predicted ferric reductase
LNNTSPSAIRTINTQETLTKNETPWAWCISRASGLMAYLLLWLVMFFGLAIRTPLLKKIFSPAFSYETHTWLSVQALILVFFHSGALLWDKYLQLKVLDLIMPFHSQIYTTEITLGILGLYLMIILILTSYFRKFFSQKIWRGIHFLNILLFIIATVHAFLLGTDLQSSPLTQNIFIGLDATLIIVLLVNIIIRVIGMLQAKKELS